MTEGPTRPSLPTQFFPDCPLEGAGAGESSVIQGNGGSLHSPVEACGRGPQPAAAGLQLQVSSSQFNSSLPRVRRDQRSCSTIDLLLAGPRRPPGSGTAFTNFLGVRPSSALCRPHHNEENRERVNCQSPASGAANSTCLYSKSWFCDRTGQTEQRSVNRKLI